MQEIKIPEIQFLKEESLQIAQLWQDLNNSYRIQQNSQQFPHLTLPRDFNDANLVAEYQKYFPIIKYVSENTLELLRRNENISLVIDQINQFLEYLKDQLCDKDDEFNQNGLINQSPINGSLLIISLFEASNPQIRSEFSDKFIYSTPVPLVYPKVDCKSHFLTFEFNQKAYDTHSRSHYQILQFSRDSNIEGEPERFINGLFNMDFSSQYFDLISSNAIFLQVKRIQHKNEQLAVINIPYRYNTQQISCILNQASFVIVHLDYKGNKLLDEIKSFIGLFPKILIIFILYHIQSNVSAKQLRSKLEKELNQMNLELVKFFPIYNSKPGFSETQKLIREIQPVKQLSFLIETEEIKFPLKKDHNQQNIILDQEANRNLPNEYDLIELELEEFSIQKKIQEIEKIWAILTSGQTNIILSEEVSFDIEKYSGQIQADLKKNSWNDNIPLIKILSKFVISIIQTNQSLSIMAGQVNNYFQGLLSKKNDLLNQNIDDSIPTSQYSEQLLFLSIYQSANKYSKYVLNQSYCQSFPLPVIYPIPRENKTVKEMNYEKNLELLWFLNPGYLIIQVSLSEKLKRKPQKFINKIFCTRFIVDDCDEITRNTAYLQQFYNIQPEQRDVSSDELHCECSWTFLDIPSTLQFTQYQIFIKKCDIYIVHINYQQYDRQIIKLQQLTEQFQNQIYSVLLVVHKFTASDFKSNPKIQALEALLKSKSKHVLFLQKDGNQWENAQRNSIRGIIQEYPKTYSYEFNFTQKLYLQFCQDQQLEQRFKYVDSIISQLASSKPALEKLFENYFFVEKIQKINQILQLFLYQPNPDEFKTYYKKLNDEKEKLSKKQSEIKYIHQIMQSFIRLFMNQDRNILLNELQKQLKLNSKNFKNTKTDSNYYLNLSVELFLRELFIILDLMTSQRLYQYYDLGKINNCLKEYILSGAPFEIIDGDLNLPMVKYYLRSLESLSQNQNIFTISVIGPTSSGKSSLLKQTFGSNFKVSDGRCTKGVYGSLLKVNKSLNLKFQYLLILDTEGLDAYQRSNDFEIENISRVLKQYEIALEIKNPNFVNTLKFDLLMSVFCFQCSNLVLLNNKGEQLSTNLKDLLTLCQRAMIILKTFQVSTPNLVIMLNQVNNTALEQVRQTISNFMLQIEDTQTILTLLSDRFSNDLKQQQMNLFQKENLLSLPNIYKGELCSIFRHEVKVLYPDDQIGRNYNHLIKRIYELTKKHSQDKYINTLQEWLYSTNFFFLQLLQENEIILLQNVDQLKQELSLKNLERRFYQEFAQDCFENLNEQKILLETDFEVIIHDMEKIVNQLLQKFQSQIKKIEEVKCIMNQFVKNQSVRRMQNYLQETFTTKLNEIQTIKNNRLRNDYKFTLLKLLSLKIFEKVNAAHELQQPGVPSPNVLQRKALQCKVLQRKLLSLEIENTLKMIEEDELIKIQDLKKSLSIQQIALSINEFYQKDLGECLPQGQIREIIFKYEVNQNSKDLLRSLLNDLQRLQYNLQFEQQQINQKQQLQQQLTFINQIKDYDLGPEESWTLGRRKAKPQNASHGTQSPVQGCLKIESRHKTFNLITKIQMIQSIQLRK